MITCGCKSRKKGKKVCHKKFRLRDKSDRPFYKMIEAMNTWDIGGDGKKVFTWDKNSEEFKRITRK